MPAGWGPGNAEKLTVLPFKPPPTPLRIHDLRCQSSYKHPSNPTIPRPWAPWRCCVTKVGEVPALVGLTSGVSEAGEAADRYTRAES